ncbi:MAG: FAD/NAD(P)-binding protein [Caldisericia bacterium]
MTDMSKPEIVEILEIINETESIKSFKLKLKNDLNYNPGQFCIVGVPGVGESAISIGSSPTQKGFIKLTIASVGAVTEKIHEHFVGDNLTFRGPFGNGFPVDKLKGKNISFMAGGVGLPAISNIMQYTFDNRNDFKRIELLYGARTPGDLVFKSELEEWKSVKDFDIKLTVDNGDKNWTHDVGVVPQFYDKEFANKSSLLFKDDPGFTNTAVIASGPPIMIKFTLIALDKIGFPKENIFVSLEARMNCGFGKCGRCNVGHHYVCQDGPVFSAAQVDEMPVF